MKTNKYLILNGPNLDLTGKREPEHYGTYTLEAINRGLAELAQNLGAEIDCVQSNGEERIINELHGAGEKYAGVVLNPGALGHYSYALRDAIAACDVPVVEVHMSNVYAREAFRANTVISDVCAGRITGLGSYGYALALRYLIANANAG